MGKYQEMFGTEQEVEAENIVDGKKKTVTEKKLVYRFTTTVKSCEELSEAETKEYLEGYKGRIAPIASSGEARADEYGLKDDDKNAMVEAFKKLDCSENITAVAKAECEVKLDDGKVVATQTVFVVKIGRSWYVDNTNVDTGNLYLAEIQQ